MTVTKERPIKNIELKSESNFTTTLKRILELLDLEEEDDYGILKPTEYAFKTAMQLVVEANEIMGILFSKGSASTDHQGSIRITWKNREKKRLVRLFCPCDSEQPVDIYHDSSDEYHVEDVSSVLTLVHWLEWLNAS
ncbi:MAG: hypothetical protein GDA56_32650 [Hormoscilla sp. GM7CHS1pb]|nr:hypothetical protein [Hormoscilla sp. GM7CHS1pb]